MGYQLSYGYWAENKVVSRRTGGPLKRLGGYVQVPKQFSVWIGIILANDSVMNPHFPLVDPSE